MGSVSDYEVMSGAEQVLTSFGVEYEKKVVSAHRTLDLMVDYIKGGAAHLAGVAAGITTLPVIAVPMQTKSLGGLDSLLSMVQMPTGIPVATVAIGGAKNAAILAVEMLALSDPSLTSKLDAFRKEQADKIKATTI